MSIEAMKQALEALEKHGILQILKFVLLMLLILGALVQQYQYQEMTALRQAIEQTDCWIKEKN